MMNMQSKLLVTSASAAMALLAAGCGGSTPTAGATPAPNSAATGTTIAVATNATIGQHLVDGKGMTVYLFVADTTTASTCYTQLDVQSNGQSCAQVWPPVLTTGAPRAGAGAQASMLGTTTRSDGKIQVTYAGHPLYYFLNDYAPGLTTGQGLNGFGGLWWVLAPSGAATH
jgi:predicted lipoprotein with Yx(FWY)xxD motif